MKITDVKVTGIEPIDYGFRWEEKSPPRRIQPILFTVRTDAGVEGYFMAYLTAFMRTVNLKATATNLKKLLVGRDPCDIEAIWNELLIGGRHDPISSAIDICLWDIVAKKAGLPLYKLLGACKGKIRAYASTVMYPTDQEFVDLALKCRDEGFNALKLHGYGVPEKDIRLCQAVRKAVGDSMDLMLDPVNTYDRRGAFKVGRALEKLDFYWYEAPISDTDVEGLMDLTRALDIPLAATESVESLRLLPQYLTTHACDQVRMIGDSCGGITTLRKAAHLCEAFGVNLEPHSYGTTLVQAAHLHVMLAMNNCEFFESPVPQGILDIGMKDVIRVAKDGCVYAPTKPGLGYDIDWDAVKKLTVEEY